MSTERPKPRDEPDGSEELRDENGTGEKADQQQLGITPEEVKDLANDAEGG
jgi:hypothetical protein